MANRAVFEIAYEGPTVDDGIMDVRELAPALLAIGNLIENSNRVIGNPDNPIKVVVRSSFERGSFQITLEIIQTLTEQIKMLFDVQNATNLIDKILISLGFVASTGISLISLLKIIKGRPIKNAIMLENGNIRLELEGENGKFDFIEVQDSVIKLYRDRSVREDLKQVLSPLEKEGITGFSVRDGKNKIESISKHEARYYDVPVEPEHEQVTTFTRRAFVNLVEVAFEEGLKWRLSDGENKFYASIEDANFLNQLESGKSFAKGDMLEVELETTQVATPKGIKNEHRVLKVISHLTKPQQISLPWDNDLKI